MPMGQGGSTPSENKKRLDKIMNGDSTDVEAPPPPPEDDGEGESEPTSTKVMNENHKLLAKLANPRTYGGVGRGPNYTSNNPRRG